MSSVINNNP
jgi:hypothetical protein